jgi:hypothetical protein
VREILLSGQDDPLDFTWTTAAHWRTTVVLKSGTNSLKLLALDSDGNLIASDSINVISNVGPQFIRGDLNLDGRVDISDPLTLLFHLFQGLPSTCEDAGDADDDEVLNVTDAIYLLDHLFRGGPAPPAPYPLPGVDPLGPALSCATGL